MMPANLCIICGVRPRDGERLWCGAQACLADVKLVPTEQLAAIREREALAAWRERPAPSGGGVYVHVTTKE